MLVMLAVLLVNFMPTERNLKGFSNIKLGSYMYVYAVCVSELMHARLHECIDIVLADQKSPRESQCPCLSRDGIKKNAYHLT